MTNGNDSAHPEIFTDLDKYNPEASGDTYSTGGLTKRELFAAMAMEGMIAGITKMDDIGIITHAPNSIAEIAIVYADTLIDTLNKE